MRSWGENRQSRITQIEENDVARSVLIRDHDAGAVRIQRRVGSIRLFGGPSDRYRLQRHLQ